MAETRWLQSYSGVRAALGLSPKVSVDDEKFAFRHACCYALSRLQANALSEWLLSPVMWRRRTRQRRNEGEGAVLRSSGESPMLGFDRITFDPDILSGKACVRGMRISVSLVVNLIANGMSVEQILAGYPDLESDDVRECLRYAAWTADEGVYPVSPGAPAA